jgi:hypothetical protein
MISLSLSVIAVILVMMSVGAVQAKGGSGGGAYQSGFNHGVSDGNDSCRHSDGCHWYILEPGKGFAFHLKEFNRGYVDGFCTTGHGGSDAEEATFDCSSNNSNGVQGDLVARPN